MGDMAIWNMERAQRDPLLHCGGDPPRATDGVRSGDAMGVCGEMRCGMHEGILCCVTVAICQGPPMVRTAATRWVYAARCDMACMKGSSTLSHAAIHQGPLMACTVATQWVYTVGCDLVHARGSSAMSCMVIRQGKPMPQAAAMQWTKCKVEFLPSHSM